MGYKLGQMKKVTEKEVNKYNADVASAVFDGAVGSNKIKSVKGTLKEYNKEVF